MYMTVSDAKIVLTDQKLIMYVYLQHFKNFTKRKTKFINNLIIADLQTKIIF